MISFRFHVVSITAVFLAIAIGIVVGTTYVDGAVVDGLRNRIDSVEHNLDDRKAENDRLERELGLAAAYIDLSGDYAVSDRLIDVPVLLLATRGVDEAAVERMALLTRRAGGTTPGVVWLEPVWDLEGDDDRAVLAGIIGSDADDAAEDLTADAWTAVVDELTTQPEEESTEIPGDPGAEGATTTVAADPPLSVLAPMAEAGFLSVDALDDAATTLADLAGTQPRILVVTGARAEPGPGVLVPVIARSAIGSELVTVVADVHVNAPEAAGRGEELLASLSEGLIEAVVIVDHADRSEGQVAAVIALDAAADAPVGHLGYGDGADGVLPAWTPP